MDLSRYGIIKVKLPLPFKLDHVNCYVARGRDGWVIIDTGLNYQPSRQAWQAFWDSNGINPSEIEGIYITHHHPDHYGGAGWLQQVSGAAVYMGSTEAMLATKIWNRTEQDTEMFLAMFLENGVPENLARDMMNGTEQINRMVNPQPLITVLPADAKIQFGKYIYKLIETPGHSDGHCCFYSEDSKILLSGDHLLPKISSNISRWPKCAPDPLQNFLDSLAENRKLQVNMALPAHGDCFTTVAERIGELEDHHRLRLEAMKNSAIKGATVYQVCLDIFGDRLSTHEVRFAVTETLAHLVYLVHRGELQVSKSGSMYRYHQ